jgi:predicted ferric reductase
MENKIKSYNRIAALSIFMVLPVLIYALGDFPRRTLLKEAISLLTIVAFFTMLMQFYLSRANRNMLRGHRMSKVIKWHKVLGYVFVSVLVFHPFFIVVPRYFEAGVTPAGAFSELLSNFNQKGLMLGLIAWILMVVIGLTSIFRKMLPFRHQTWRIVHGVLSILFILIASFHVIGMGRHINQAMAWVIAVLSVIGVSLLLKAYIFNSGTKKQENDG